MSKNNRSSRELAACIQVRTFSKRIKKKALQKILGKTLLEHCYERLKKIVSNEYPIFILTSDHSSDKEIVNLCREKNYKYFKGSKNNVISRYNKFLISNNYKNILRATCDNIFINVNSCKKIIAKHLKYNLDYSTNHYSGLPKGSGVDIFKSNVVKIINRSVNNLDEKEHINKFILKNKNRFNTYFYKSRKKSKFNLSIDTYEDLKNIKLNFKSIDKKF